MLKEEESDGDSVYGSHSDDDDEGEDEVCLFVAFWFVLKFKSRLRHVLEPPIEILIDMPGARRKSLSLYVRQYGGESAGASLSKVYPIKIVFLLTMLNRRCSAQRACMFSRYRTSQVASRLSNMYTVIENWVWRSSLCVLSCSASAYPWPVTSTMSIQQEEVIFWLWNCENSLCVSCFFLGAREWVRLCIV